jgi:hypothetical protein
MEGGAIAIAGLEDTTLADDLGTEIFGGSAPAKPRRNRSAR